MRVKIYGWGMVAVLVLVALLSACGSASTGARTTDPRSTPTVAPSLNIDACTLVTAAEMSKIVGAALTAQPKTLQNGDPACNFKPADGALQPSVLLGVHKDGQNYYSSAQSLYKGTSGYKEVSGVGNQAFDSGDGTFYTLKGDTCVDVVIIQNPEVRSAQLKQIATLAVGRLP